MPGRGSRGDRTYVRVLGVVIRNASRNHGQFAADPHTWERADSAGLPSGNVRSASCIGPVRHT